METNQAGLDLIKSSEGLRLTAYQDSVGVWTIGYGHTGSDVCDGLTIDNDQAQDLLKADLKSTENHVTNAVKIEINENQFSALVSFTYNLGIGTLLRSTLLAKLNGGDTRGAAQEFLKWDRAGGQVLAGLEVRRQKEQDLFLEDC